MSEVRRRFSEFYNDAVNEHEELLKTEALQVLNKAKPVFGVCEMTFVLEPKNKSKLLQIESALSAFTACGLHSGLYGGLHSGPHSGPHSRCALHGVDSYLLYLVICFHLGGF